MVDEPGTSLAATTWSDARIFEQHAAKFLGELWNVHLAERLVVMRGGVTKKFDLVSEDASIVGDAKFYKNIPVPAAKWSTIAKYVWLLQHVDAARRFMVFGLDQEVASRWLERFRPLAEGVEFYFLDAAGLTTL
jgi:hypothetical protein